jgi:hypothetical protein
LFESRTSNTSFDTPPPFHHLSSCTILDLDLTPRE